MPIATKQQLIVLHGPEPITEIFEIPGTDLHIALKGIVRSAERSAIYSEIEEMTGIADVTVRGERIKVTEDDIVAACWAAACVRNPQLTSMEWLIVGATNADLLRAVGFRALVCSRLATDGNLPDGRDAALLTLTGDHADPLDSTPIRSVSTDSEGFPQSSNGRSIARESVISLVSTD